MSVYSTYFDGLSVEDKSNYRNKLTLTDGNVLPVSLETIIECKGDIKGSWKVINEIINTKSKPTNIDYIKDCDQEISNNREIANTMNDYFCTVGAGLANNFEETENSLSSGKYQIKSSTANFKFRPIMVQDIGEAIAKLTTSKSFGTDTTSSYFLKMALPFLENSIAMLFITSLETSIFPDICKISRLAPIYKEGDKSEKSNHRPISVLQVI